MDDVIFGDNQFFGINHMSEAKAQAQAERFRDTRAIVDVIEAAYDCGIRGFMLNTHDQVSEICEHLRSNRGRYADMRLYPSLPYAHKYANAVNEKGLVGAINDFLFADRSAMQVLGTLTRGGKSLVQRDLMEVMKLLVDAEMRMFRGLAVQVVFLQNIVTDLLLGMNARAVVAEFARYIRKRFDVEPGFNTMNLPACVDFLLEAGVENPIVCASINKAGYLMSPGPQAYEEAIRTKPFRALAMSVLASGAIPAREAVEYVANLGRIESIVFGASSRPHIEQTLALIRTAWADRRLQPGGVASAELAQVGGADAPR
jgi:hypothetical protein